MNKRNKSIIVNAILNMFNTFLTMTFSLLTFPYASRVLQVENIGKVNYSNAIVSYFALFAALGFNTYAIREGSRYKKNQNKLNDFINEIFSFNLFTVILAYVFLFLVICLNEKFYPYMMLILIQSFSMINMWINVGYINVIYEDYVFIALRSIIVQLLSIVLMYVFVKNKDDYYIYSFISVSAQSIVSILNFIHSQKYCRIRFSYKINIKKHIKPVLIFFSNTLAVSIYLNADTTMIGYWLNDYQVGLYSAAVKIYSAVRNLIASIYNVVINRMSQYASENNMEGFSELLNIIINTIIVIVIPTTIGMICLSRNLIQLLCGEEYLNATNSLQILSCAFFFAVVGGLFAYCIEVPLKNEKRVLKVTVISAVENIVLNIFLIPTCGIKGAAITTLLAEYTVFSILVWRLKERRKLFKFECIKINLIKVLIASAPMTFIPFFMKGLQAYNDIYIVVYFGVSVILFVIISILIKNIWVLNIFKRIRNYKIV